MTERYQSLRPRLRWTEGFIWPAMGCYFALLCLQASSVLVLGGALPEIWPGGWDGYGRIADAVIALLVLSGLGGAATFLRWQRQAARNLSVLWWGAVEYDASRSTWSWFVPIANLFMPLHAFRELAEKSSGKRRDIDLKPLVGLWWGLFWCARLFDQISAQVMDANDTETMIVAFGFSILAAGCGMLSGFYVIVLLRQLTARQEQTWNGLRTADQAT